MIEVKNLTKKYGNHTAVDNISFTVEPGRIYGFLGPNGAGKSTTMNIITGCLASTSGNVIIDGNDIFDNPIDAKKHIGYLPEIPPLYPDMTPYEYLSFVADSKKLNKVEKAEQIKYVMEVTGITERSNKLIKNLSKGYKQRVGIAQAMLGNPDIIILDEPTVGLDPKQIIEIRDLIKSLSHNHTVILSSHILPEVSYVCDYVMILSRGKLVASDTLENLTDSLTGQKEIALSVRGNENDIKMTINEIEGINSYEIMANDKEIGVYDINIETEKSVDIRDQLFFKFASKNMPIISLVNKTITLEDVFLKLTSDNDVVETPEEYDEEYTYSENEEYESPDDSDYSEQFGRKE